MTKHIQTRRKSRRGTSALIAVAMGAVAAAMWGTSIIHLVRFVPQSEQLAHLADAIRVLIVNGFDRSPVVMAGMAVGLAIPVLTLVLTMARGLRRWVSSRSPLPAVQVASGATQSPTSAKAWIEIDGPSGRGIELAGELLQIGRHVDNDVTLTDRGVDDSHAVIHRTSEGAYLIVDVSGTHNGGVLVNDQKRGQATLKDGDRITLGLAHVTFRRGTSAFDDHSVGSITRH